MKCVVITRFSLVRRRALGSIGQSLHVVPRSSASPAFLSCQSGERSVTCQKRNRSILAPSSTLVGPLCIQIMHRS